MVGAIQLANYIKQNNYSSPIIFIGSHIQALPLKTLNEEPSIDIVCTNEGVYSLHNVLKIKSFSADELQNVNGIGFKKNGVAQLTKPEKVVPQEKWILIFLAMHGIFFHLKINLLIYRAPMWHAEYLEENRTPYAAIQTSLGCQFGYIFLHDKYN